MRFRRAYRAACVVAGGVWWLIGCTGAPAVVTDAAADSAHPDGGAGPCVRDQDCDDHVFCNGVEHCVGVDGGTGCRSSGTSPCATGEHCEEATARCVAGACATPDADGDGVDAIACGGTDCDDADRARYPGNAEVCDAVGHDEDCDPCTVASTADGDGDGDGYPSAACRDAYPAGAPLCDAMSTRIDAATMQVTGSDCDDTLADVHPSQVEVCNGLDDNCDGNVDEGVLRSFYIDMDGDGYGAAGSTPMIGCNPPPHYVADDLDCDDGNRSRNPAIVEVCDGVDDNCNGVPDDGEVPTYFFPDDDHDGHGDGSRPRLVLSCNGPTGFLRSFDDCDDTSAGIRPGAVELCDRRDDDCDGVDAVATEDADGDHHAPLSATCVGGYPHDDCDDTHAGVFPGAAELCNGLDDDCDGTPDDGSALLCSLSQSCLTGLCTDVGGLGVGAMHTCVRRADGTVVCWGRNVVGELGDGTTTDHATPLTVVGLTDAVQVATGDTPNWGGYSCARDADGGVECWGRARMLGDEDPDLFVPTPARISFAGRAIDLDAGPEYACLVSALGEVWCWGGRTSAGAVRWPSPTPVVGVSDAVEVAVGDGFACALSSYGAVLCWGSNRAGQIGIGVIDDSGVFRSPTAPLGLGVVRQLAASDVDVCALTATGTVSCWGHASAFGGGPSRPTLVPGVTAVEIAIGGTHTCARLASGAVSCWGDDAEGELGDGGAGFSLVPVAVVGLTDAVELDAAGVPPYSIQPFGSAACARRAAGGVVCWGSNEYGQVGNGSVGGSRNTPVPVVGLP